MIKISTSILQSNNIHTILKLNDTATDYLHIDVMDGLFVTNEAFPLSEIEEISQISKKPLDVHLMVHDVDAYLDSLIALKVHSITFHYETMVSLDTIKKIKNNGIICGISVKPTTDIEKIFYLLDKIDMVLIMSVEPGYGGQAFDYNSIERIKKLKKEIVDHHYSVSIAVDGGITNHNYRDIIHAGADILVVGSYITNSSDYRTVINELKGL